MICEALGIRKILGQTAIAFEVSHVGDKQQLPLLSTEYMQGTMGHFMHPSNNPVREGCCDLHSTDEGTEVQRG